MKKKISSKNLERAQLFLKYKEDVVFWSENCVYLPTSGGDKLVHLYEPQKKILKEFYDNHFLVLLKSRQTGFSTLSQIIVAHMATFYPNIVMGIISRDGNEASDFNRKVIDILDKQPKWLRPLFDPKKGGFKNAQSFKTNNGSQLWSAAVSPANPGAVFRGKSLTLLIMDEAAHVRYIDEAWTGIGPSLAQAQNVAKKQGIPFGTIILSTPNRTEGIGKWYFQRWQQALGNPTGLWKPHKIYWKEIPDFINNPNWYQQQCEILGNDPKRIAQELELQFVPAGGIFPENVYKDLQNKGDKKPVEIIRISEGSELWRFKEVERNKYYLMGVDTASEFGEDFSTIQVVEFETMDQILEFKGKLAVREFVRILKFVAQLCPRHLIVIENNSYGTQVCEEMYAAAEQNNYSIYGKWVVHKIPGSQSKRKAFQPGISTNAKTRPLIMDALYTYVVENTNLVRSERLALELISLVDKGNRIEADLGANDDLAMAYGFCCYARHYLKEALGNNICDQAPPEYNPINWIGELNENKPLQGAMRDAENINVFHKTADKYIDRNFDKLSGKTVNVFDLILDQNKGMFE